MFFTYNKIADNYLMDNEVDQFALESIIAKDGILSGDTHLSHRRNDGWPDMPYHAPTQDNRSCMAFDIHLRDLYIELDKKIEDVFNH